MTSDNTRKSNLRSDGTIQEFHLAPPQYHGDRKRSILKEHHDDTLVAEPSFPERRSRKSSNKEGHVHFDATVENLSTITKIRGLAAALGMNPGRMKFHPQVNNSATSIELMGSGDYVSEKYPPHLKSFQKKAHREGCYEPFPGVAAMTTDENKLENKTARQDLARLYFTNEATRLLACTNLRAATAVVDRKEPPVKPPQTIPHFFMERLLADQEASKKREKCAKIQKLKSELDAFDKDVSSMSPETCSPFDPRQKCPEKSLRLVKQKMDILKMRRERDSKAAMKRYRCRKAYFHQMLPSFDSIEKDLMDYVDGLVPRQSSAEIKFIQELNGVTNHHIFQEYERVKAVQDAMDVVFETSMKIVGYRYATGEEVPSKLAASWRADIYSDILGLGTCDNEVERLKNDIQKHKPLQERNINFDYDKSKTIQDTIDVLLETTMKVIKSRCGTKKDPPKGLEAEWRADIYAAIDWLECSDNAKNMQDINEVKHHGLFQQCVNQSEASKTAQEILDVLLETTMKVIGHRQSTGEEPSKDMEVGWRDEAYAAIIGLDDEVDVVDADSEATKAAQDTLNVLLETMMEVVGYRYVNDEDPPLNIEMEWRSGACAKIDRLESFEFDDVDSDATKNVENVLDVLFEIVMKVSAFRHAVGEDPPKIVELEWIEDAYAAVDGVGCIENENTDSNTLKTVQVLLDVLLETVMKVIGHKQLYEEDPSKDCEAEWREELYSAFSGWEYIEDVEAEAEAADE